MTLSNKQNAPDPDALERAIKCFYSHRPEDTEGAKQFIEGAILAGKVKADDHPTDIVNILLLGAREGEYLTVRSLALQLLRNPGRIGTTSAGETLAGALLFAREDWLGSHTWASAAQRVGQAWLKAIVEVEEDFKWMEPPTVLKGDQASFTPHSTPRVR